MNSPSDQCIKKTGSFSIMQRAVGWAMTRVPGAHVLLCRTQLPFFLATQSLNSLTAELINLSGKQSCLPPEKLERQSLGESVHALFRS